MSLLGTFENSQRTNWRKDTSPVDVGAEPAVGRDMVPDEVPEITNLTTRIERLMAFHCRLQKILSSTCAKKRRSSASEFKLESGSGEAETARGLNVPELVQVPEAGIETTTCKASPLNARRLLLLPSTLV